MSGTALSGARIGATYRVRASEGEAHALAGAIALEQTVELPAELVTDPAIRDGIVGRVESVEIESGAHALVKISYSAALGGLHLSQLLNLIYGNVSIYPNVRLIDIDLPQAVLAGFRGPNFGIDGLRARVGVHGRPLLATALKPNGSSIETLASLAGAFALGGGDIVKDDQNLIDDFEHFKGRVAACREAVDAANQHTGRQCLYLPHISGAAGDLRRQLAYVRELGLAGVLVCPLILGFDTVRTLAAEFELLMMAHPSLTGTYTNSEDGGIAHELLLGTLFRLAGADISIFPNAGGRFSFAPGECEAISQRLREPLGALAPTWPAPAGGMSFESLAALSRDYGADAVLLIGGALLGHDEDLARGTRAFRERIEAHFESDYRAPAVPKVRALADPQDRLFRFSEGFEWQHRPSSPYKDAADASFKGVRRVELVGKYGERTNADLRYFEVEAGGHSSREKHLHTHIIIGARGRGRLEIGNRQVNIGPMDVAYIEPLEPHQLINQATDEPFGFFCIVDHERDRPMSV